MGAAGPGFPDTIFIGPNVTPSPGFEIKAWFPLATEITARFKDSQKNAKRKRVPFRCREKECGKQFSTKTATFMQSSKIGYKDWLYAMYLVATNLKSLSSMKLHREIGITQKAAWHLAHRIRKAWSAEQGELFGGPVESMKPTSAAWRKTSMPANACMPVEVESARWPWRGQRPKNKTGKRTSYYFD